MIKAVIDIGTNSTRVLVAKHSDEEMVLLYTDLAITRIGEGIGHERIIKDEPLKRTIAAVKGFVDKAHALGAEKIRITATSAVRDAENKEQVQIGIHEACGIPLEILSGEVEARLSYLGASSDFLTPDQTIGVLDIGGGSTELVYPSGDGISCHSVNVGAVRLMENKELCIDLTSRLQGLLDGDVQNHVQLVGVGGTITTLVAMELGLKQYESSKVHGYSLTEDLVEQWIDKLEKMSLEEKEQIPGLAKQRADIIIYGLYILKNSLELLQCDEIIVSDKDILVGSLQTMT